MRRPSENINRNRIVTIKGNQNEWFMLTIRPPVTSRNDVFAKRCDSWTLFIRNVLVQPSGSSSSYVLGKESGQYELSGPIH